MVKYHEQQKRRVTRQTQRRIKGLRNTVTQVRGERDQARGERDQARGQLQQAKNLIDDYRSGKVLKKAKNLAHDHKICINRMRKEKEELKSQLNAKAMQIQDANKELELLRKDRLGPNDEQELQRLTASNRRVRRMAEEFDADRKKRDGKKKKRPDPEPESDDDDDVYYGIFGF